MPILIAIWYVGKFLSNMHLCLIPTFDEVGLSPAVACKGQATEQKEDQQSDP